MKIVERNRAGAFAPTRIYRREAEVDRLQRQLRRATERNHAQFDQGFQAAIIMVEAGATIDRLKEASGVVAQEWEDTQPMDVVECFDSEEITITDGVVTEYGL